MAKLNIPTDGGAKGVSVIKQGFNVDPLIQHQAACISTMTYNEYWQVIDAGYKPSDLMVFKYSDEGVGMLEDGLYANGDKLKDKAYVTKLAKFVAASDKGWAWAVKHPDEAAQIVLDNDATGAQTLKHQKQMMHEVAKLVDIQKPLGYLVLADYERTVSILLRRIGAGHHQEARGRLDARGLRSVEEVLGAHRREIAPALEPLSRLSGRGSGPALGAGRVRVSLCVALCLTKAKVTGS